MALVEYGYFPSSLPLPQSNFSGTHKSPTQTTNFASGKVRRRKIGRNSVKLVTLEWLFTPDEYDLWEAFHRVTLGDGCTKFLINMPSGGPLQTGEHVVQCVGDPSFSHEECNWRVSIECILYPYPTMKDEDILEGYLGFTIDQMEDIINKYLDRNYML